MFRTHLQHGNAGRLDRIPKLVGVAVATGIVGVTFTSAVATAATTKAQTKTLYVSARGSNRHPCTKKAPCKTIARAVKLAPAGGTVSVAHGTYRADVKLTKDVAVVGVRRPVINASGRTNGFLITGSHAAGATVKGFMVEHASFEGILAERTSDVTIADNTVEHNDLGLNVKHPTGECASTSGGPGDCGEALHLMSVTHSRVLSNLVEDNDGGILLTDELGPTALNLISHNRSLDNALDCGITIASHNTNAVSASGTPQPAVAGVYDNEIVDNVADGNGTKGQGAGILLAAPGPGTATYNNIVDGNTADGDGLAGITLHSHAPGQDLNGNVITDNTVSDDGINGYPNGTPGDSDFGVTHTVGILAASAVNPLAGIVIAGNKISDVYYGIWTLNVPTISASANSYTSVTAPLTQS